MMKSDSKIIHRKYIEELSCRRVVKRDGRSVKYDHQNIYNSLFNSAQYLANQGVKFSKERIHYLEECICRDIEEEFDQVIKIGEIRNIVERCLIAEKEYHLLKVYQDYRVEQDLIWKETTNIELAIKKLINNDQGVVNENANKDSKVFNTQRDLTAGLVGKAVGLNMLPSNVAKAHQKGDIHYHDLDYHPYTPMTNCCLIDFERMLNRGFKIGNADVEPPKSIQTAAAQISQIIANVASSQYGGCSVNRIDELLAPFAALNYEKHFKEATKWIKETKRSKTFAEEKTKKDIYDSMQSLEYEINTLFTSNGQTPFTSLGFGLGKNWYEREIQKAILTIRIAGLGREKRTAMFPKLIFTLKRKLNLEAEDPNYDIKQLALQCATQRMYPDVLMYGKIKELTGSFKVPMGCRSFLQGWKNEEGKDISAGRMNLGVVTLNLPRIAMEARGDKRSFWQLFHERLLLVKEALEYRITRCQEAKPENAPILYMYGAFGQYLKAGEKVKQLFHNKRATVSVGYIGLYEVATAFYGGNWEDNEEAKAFTLAILKEMKMNTDKWSDELGYHFSVYSTPSESLTDRFCRLDFKKFGKVKNITDKEYYTNSFHYDVRKNPTPFEKLEFEKEYPQYCSGGFIHYCEYPVMRQNPKALEAVWDFAYDRVGYLGTNTPIDRCYQCDFSGDFTPTAKGFKCPQCGNQDPNTSDVVKRTCGYLGNPQARPMVHGRHKEISSRKKHMK